MFLIHQIKKYYDSLPTGLLKGMGALYYRLPESKRYGKDFQIARILLNQTEKLSSDKIEQLVNERFLSTVKYAYSHVPYYRKTYDEYGINMNAIKDTRDIVLLPTINKDTIRKHGKELLSDEYKISDLMYVTTSGSTGSPVGFYQEKSIMMIEWAYTMHIWSRIGCLPQSCRLVLRGKMIHPNKNDPDIFYDPLRRELNCNIFNMTEDNMERYCCAVERYKPEYIHGYMSAIVMLVKYIASRKNGLNHRFKGVLATSENIIEDQKKYVEKILGVRVFSFYGHSERLVIAGECEESNCYHVEPLYGYCELLNGLDEPSETGDITGTGFLNHAMPLIRYRTGDIAAWEQTDSCACGRSHRRLKGVFGRWNQDMLVNRTGAYISLAALNIHSNEFDLVARYKLIQDTPGVVIMKVVPLPGFNMDCANKIKMLLEKKSGYKICFDIQIVDSLPLMDNGKYNIVEQKLPIILN